MGTTVRRTRKSERGASALLMALVVAFLMVPLCAISLDMSRWWVVAQRAQAAADAAATAGVTFMPEEFEKAKARALEIAEDNGFEHGVNATVSVSVGARPTQLRVSVASTVENQFARLFGVESTTLTRAALTDFTGPAPMGSPCNTFGNEPAGSAQNGPQGSVLKAPTHAQCSTNPQFWGAIAGPETHKDQGAQFEARKCGGGEVECTSAWSGATNKEFDPRGYVYMVRVTEQAIGRPVQLQIYDPAYVDTASGCSTGPVGSISSWDNDRYPQATSDAHNRYRNSANTFCTGDSDNNGKRFGGEVPTTTSFALREPHDSLNPFHAPVHKPAECIKQWPGYSHTTGYGGSSLSTSMLRNSGSGHNYQAHIARVFHQWVDLCTFTPTRAGDWYLQVRSNVRLGSGALDATGAVRGNMAVVNQSDDDLAEKGNGTNNFSVRAISTAPAGAVSVSSWERMRIYANASSASSTFNLVRVVPAAATKTLVVSYYDVGEATGTSGGTVKLVPPADSNLPTNIQGCKGSGVVNGSLTNCQLNNVNSSNNNGKTQVIRVPIPPDYTCQSSSQGGCWFRVTVSFPGATVTDATTWTARISGEPVRLID